MKSKILRTVSLIIIILLWSVSYSLGQNKQIDKTHKVKMENISRTSTNEPQFYKGIINLKAIDQNKDGKVFQCPMDFNVLSDKPGIDPKCGMKLKEVTIKEAKENLLKHGFRVKE